MSVRYRGIWIAVLLLLLVCGVGLHGREAYGQEPQGNDMIFGLKGEDVNHDGSQVIIRVSMGNSTADVLPVCRADIHFPAEGVTETAKGEVVNEYGLVLHGAGTLAGIGDSAGLSPDDPQTLVVRTVQLQPGETREYIFYAHTETGAPVDQAGKLTAYVDIRLSMEDENGGLLAPSREIVREIPFYIAPPQTAEPETEPETQPETAPEPEPSWLLEITLMETAVTAQEEAAGQGDPGQAVGQGGSQRPAGEAAGAAALSADAQTASAEYRSGKAAWGGSFLWICLPAMLLPPAAAWLLNLRHRRRRRKQEERLHFDPDRPIHHSQKE